MKKSIVFIALLIIATSCQAQKRIKGNGKITSITRTTSDYNTVSFAGPFDYILISGKEGLIKIEGEENLLQYIVTEVKNGKLNIKTENNTNLQTSINQTIKITVPFEKISEASLTGSGDLWNESVIEAESFKVSVTGSGDAKLKINATTTEASVTGSGELDVKGKTDNLKVSVTGSGEFKGMDLNANNVDVSVSGSGDAKVFCNGHLKARVTGSGDIKYKGNPKTEDTKVAGSGSIRN